jgi:predicted secreted Zn-dependent protease
MGAGLIRAVAATAIRTKHVVLEKQLNHQQVVVRCTRCKIVMTFDMPSPIQKLTAFLRKCEHDHKDCQE